MQGAPVMMGGPAQNLNRLGQVVGQGNWGPGSQWYQNHRAGMMNGNPVMGGQQLLGALGGGQMQGAPVMANPGQFQQGQQQPQMPPQLNPMQWQRIMQIMQGGGGMSGGGPQAGQMRPNM